MGKLNRAKPAANTNDDLAALRDLIMTNVVARIDLDTEDEDFVNRELKWLFTAADNLLQICRGNIDRSHAISVPIPADAQTTPEANNALLDNPKDVAFSNILDYHGRVETRWQTTVEKRITHYLDLINSHLRSLNILLNQETALGEAAKTNTALQAQISMRRIELMKAVQDMAQFMDKAYGVLISSPGQMIAYMEG